MFCKHCGGKLTVGQHSCGHCGTAVGAMSDCGGFYDLVKVEQPAAPAPQAKKSGPWIPVLLCVVAVRLVLVVVLVVKQSQLTEEIESLQDEIEELCEEAEAEETTEEQEETGSVTNDTTEDTTADTTEEITEETTEETTEEQEVTESTTRDPFDLFAKEKSEIEDTTESEV